MKNQKTYQTIDQYIQHTNIANQNGAVEGDIFGEAIEILQQMKMVAASENVVGFNGSSTNAVTEEEYDELIEWLESLDKTRH